MKSNSKTLDEIGEMMRGKRANSSQDFITALSDYIHEQRLGKCQVFWGRHACDKRPDSGDTPHQHRCKCDATPQPHSVLWGPDMLASEITNRPHCQVDLAAVEKMASYADPFDNKGRFRPERQRRGVRYESWKKQKA
jgi:hypothetical protein